MMIVMKATATNGPDPVGDRPRRGRRGQGARLRGEVLTLIGAIGEHEEQVAGLGLEADPAVEQVVPILKPYKLASTQLSGGEKTIVDIEGRKMGGATSR